eukprot:m.69196 g.69196  ORF g.69196 m.69196 type:complete len:256 (+) comp13962_c0_seq2:741-1508(+)
MCGEKRRKNTVVGKVASNNAWCIPTLTWCGLLSKAKLFDTKLSGTTHTGEIGTPTYRAPEVVREEGYGYPSDVYALGVVFLELFHGVLDRFDRDKAALAYVADMREKMSDKPLPALLKALLHPDADQRPTPAEAMQLAVFANLKEKTPPFVKVHNKLVRLDKASAKKAKGAKRDSFELLHERLEMSNPLTIEAARAYEKASWALPRYCLVLASKMYEEDLVTMGFVQSVLPDFDVDAYRQAELLIFRAMEFCLYI